MMKKIYENRKIVLLTKHKKEDAIKLTLERATGAELIVETRFDTDKLGTFSREMKRSKSQLETARTKIKKGLKLSKTDIGIASEGSFGTHPYAPVPWNVELVLLYDKKDNNEIYGIYEGTETNLAHLRVDNLEDTIKFAKQIGFPEHFLIMRPDDEYAKQIIKDIDSFEKLKEAFNVCKLKSKTGHVFIETDMRAHANPTRMRNIEKATQDLVSNIMKLCPKCDTPGFVIQEAVKGLPCERCGLASEMTLKYIYRCKKCKYEMEALHPNGPYAAAQYCHYCNP